MKNDVRSTVGMYLRGRNVYNGGSTTSPNPQGKNQYPANLSKLAKLRRKKMKRMM